VTRVLEEMQKMGLKLDDDRDGSVWNGQCLVKRPSRERLKK